MVIGMLLRSYFSLHHAQMAAYHARMAQSLELDGSEEAAIALGAHVSAAVISAGAFLDATANEVAENDARPRSRATGIPASLLRLNELLEDANVPKSTIPTSAGSKPIRSSICEIAWSITNTTGWIWAQRTWWERTIYMTVRYRRGLRPPSRSCQRRFTTSHGSYPRIALHGPSTRRLRSWTSSS